MQALREDKLSYLPLLAALAAVGFIVFVLVSDFPPTGKATASSRESTPLPQSPDTKRTEALLAGVPQHGAALGDPEAPVTLQFFGDLQCMDSRRVMLGALPFLIRHWVRDGKLRIVYRSAETDTHGLPEFRRQQIAALAAGPQAKMWTFIDLFYREQRPEFTHYADDDFLEGIAEQAGVDLEAWANERDAEGWASDIEFDETLAEKRDMGSTPSFLIGPTGGRAHVLRHFSFEEPSVFDEAIEEFLQ